ncbi:carbonic anhydrase 1-like [Littorina saxatilis]
MTRYPECSGLRQSPINIVTSRMRFRDIEPINMLDYTPLSSTFTVTYNGAGLTLRPRSNIHLTGLGDRNEIYTMANIHFHWSSQHTYGSEHAIDGVKFPMEMHVLCYNTKYGSRNAAMAHKDGLAAMAVIWDIGKPSPALWPIMAATTRMTTVGEEVASSGLDLRGLFPAKALPSFRYHGSMTTPPCKENVMWTICEHVQTMSYQQFKMFQDMRRGPLAQNGFIGDNSRPLQAAYSRILVTNNPLFSG